MSNSESESPTPVPQELIEAALRLARSRNMAVGDVPLQAIAQEAGISRSTLLRRLGGGRRELDAAVRAAGVDPGGQKPVRERAVEAAATLISSSGLASMSLERVAASAQCSVHSLYAAFSGRDGLLQAVFERYSPIVDIEAVVSSPSADLETTVRTIYERMAIAVQREPRVMPAIMAELLARPQDEALQPLVRYAVPRLFAGVGKWLTTEIAAGRIRDLPLLLLIQQMSSPLVTHILLRPATTQIPDLPSPTVEEACTVFADNFLRAVALPAPPENR